MSKEWYQQYGKAHQQAKWDALTPTERKEKNRSNYLKRKMKLLTAKIAINRMILKSVEGNK